MPAGKRTGDASLPLHGGKAPAWLSSRMVLLSREILTHLVEEYGAREVLRRMSDLCGFQALLLFAAGGKGAASKESPVQ